MFIEYYSLYYQKESVNTRRNSCVPVKYPCGGTCISHEYF